MSVFLARCLAYTLLVPLPVILAYYLPKITFSLLDWTEGILNWYPLICGIVIGWKAFQLIAQNFDPYDLRDFKPFVTAALKLWGVVLFSQLAVLALLGVLFRQILKSALTESLSPVVADFSTYLFAIIASLLVAVFAFKRARETFFTGEFAEYRRHTMETRHVHRGIRRR